MILPKIIKEELGEDVYNQMSDICNQPSPEKEYKFWMSGATMKKWNIVLEKEAKKFIK